MPPLGGGVATQITHLGTEDASPLPPLMHSLVPWRPWCSQTRLAGTQPVLLILLPKLLRRWPQVGACVLWPVPTLGFV